MGNGVILTITDDTERIMHFEMKSMYKALKFVNTFNADYERMIRDIEIHEIDIPNYDK